MVLSPHRTATCRVASFVLFLSLACDVIGVERAVVSDTDHGKIVEFHRRKKVLGERIPLDHKGVLFVPSAYDGDLSLLRDSDGQEIRGIPYVLHFTTMGDAITNARIRLDPLQNIILGDPWSIKNDEAKALPVAETIKIALSMLGKTPNNESYDLFGNNCGNFAAYVKYGRRGADTQVIDRCIAMFNALTPDAFAPHVAALHKKLRR